MIAGVGTTPLTSLQTIEAAIRHAWSVWTCDPVDQFDWSQSNPARGQCASTALVVHDLLGGTLRIADVQNADGSENGVHFWNELAGGLEVDLTREQFRCRETFRPARSIDRPTDLSRGRLPGNYRLLSMRVRRELHGVAERGRARPLSVKGVFVDDAGRVLLCRNHRGEWELPGGRPDRGELFSATLVREVQEETSLQVTVDRLIDGSEIEVQPGTWVDILAYACEPDETAAPRPLTVSAEHTAVAFRHLADCSAEELPDAYRSMIASS